MLELLEDSEKEFYNNIVFIRGSISDFAMSIGKLIKWLEKYYKEKVILLIDEYDAPINEGFTRGYYEDVIDFIKNLFGGAMKNNLGLKKAVLTGVTRIAGRSLFSELNNFRSYNVLSEEYSEYFGFTEDEVKKVLDQCEVEHDFEEIKSWYNGYTFGKSTSIYNPWSIMNVAYGKNQKLAPYWANTTSNSILKDHLANKSIKIKEGIMKYRRLGKTGYEVSEISLGTWQLGGRWGESFDEKKAESILNTAIDNGVNFIDTADVYNDGMSEKMIGKVLKKRTENIKFATKCGRRLNPHLATGYNRENIRRFVEDSLKNMELEALDLLQLHCPPTEVYYNGEVFDALDELKKEGKIINYGVSVEKVEEALKAIEYTNIASVQLIFNMFRQKPAEIFFKEAKKKDVGIIVRVPLASGLLTGKMSNTTEFLKGDHRSFNRNGEAFDKGETFSGVDYEIGLQAVEELKRIFLNKEPLAQIALRWILMFDDVSCVIPGASSEKQIASNVDATILNTFTATQMAKVTEIYEKYIKTSVHHLW